MLAKVKFAGVEIGLISEQGVEFGGSDPEYAEVTAAQTRSVVKKLLKKAGQIDINFNLIELNVDNLIHVAGGSADTTTPGKWNAPVTPVVKEGVLEIEAVTGQVVSAPKATLSAGLKGTLGGDDPLSVGCMISILNDGVNPPYSIDNTAPETPAG